MGTSINCSILRKLEITAVLASSIIFMTRRELDKFCVSNLTDTLRKDDGLKRTCFSQQNSISLIKHLKRYNQNNCGLPLNNM